MCFILAIILLILMDTIYETAIAQLLCFNI